MALNNTDQVEIKIDVEDTVVNLAADPLCIDADSAKTEDCTWNPLDYTLGLEFQPDIAGQQFLQKALLAQPGCSAYNPIEGGEVTSLAATDPLSLESEQFPKIEDALKQEDCSQDPPTDFLYQNENNQEKGKLQNEVIHKNRVNLMFLGTGEIHGNVANCSKYTQNSTEPSTSYQPLKCEKCGKLYLNKAYLMFHDVQMHQSKEVSESLTSTKKQPKILKCDQCESQFTSRGNLRYHKTRIHRSKVTEQPIPIISLVFKCDQCERSFINSSRLQYHKKKMHLPNATVQIVSVTNSHLKCDDCKRTFTSRSNLNSHKAKMHMSTEEKEKMVLTRKQRKIYKCDQCDKSYIVNVSLRAHKTKMHKTKDVSKDFATISEKRNPNSDFKCDLCDRSYASNGSLRAHKTKMHKTKDVSEDFASISEKRNPNSDFKCDQCDRSYTSNVFLIQHKIRMHKRHAPWKKQFKCGMCKRSYHNESGLKRHKKEHHPFSGSKQPAILSQFSKCEKCTKSFASRIPYLCHEVIHHQSSLAKKELQYWTSKLPAKPTIGKDQNSKTQQLNGNESTTNGCHNCLSSILHRCHLKNDTTVNKCRYCSQVFDSQKYFNEHLLTHHQHLRSACVFCETRFGNKQALINHLSANKCPRLLCKICLEQVFSQKNVIEHKERHAEEHNIKCGFCPKVLKNRKLLRMHMKIHTEPPKPWKCPICTKTLKTATFLKLHIAKHSCKICGLKFPVIGNPANKKHILTHNIPSMDNVTCNICDKILCNKEYLKTHLLQHFKDQRIKCHLCKSTYSQTGALAYHMRTRHTSEQKFKCEICGMSFAEEVDLVIHKRNRHNIQPTDPILEKPKKEIMYKCTLCSKEYVTKRGLSNHSLVEHNTDSEEVLVCDVCAMVFTEPNDLKLHWLKHTGLETLQYHLGKKCNKPSIQKVVADQQNSPIKNEHASKVDLVENRTINRNFMQCGTAEMAPVELTADCVLLSQMGVASLHMGEDRLFSSKEPIRGGESVPDAAAAADLDLLMPENANALPDFVLPSELLDSQKEPGTTECKICNTTFATGLELESHRQNHWDLKLTRKEAKLFERRIKTHGIGSYTCSNCKKKFFVRNEFKEHLKSVVLNLDGKLTCDQKKVHKSLRKPLPCKVCGKAFSSMTGFYLHMRVHPNWANDITRVKCTICPATFRSSRGCYQHMKSHKNIRPILRKTIPCATCGKTFSNVVGLRAHKRTHTTNPTKLITTNPTTLRKCSMCPAIFKYTLAFNRHMRSHKNATRAILREPLSCNICGKTYSTVFYLNLHMQAHAIKLRCSMCSATFKSRSGHLKHMRSHEKLIMSGEANILNAEAMCKKKSSSGDKVISKTFEGRTYAATFKSKSELNMHNESHQTEKTVCSVCNGTFTSSAVQLVDKWRQSIMYKMPTESIVTSNATPKPIKCAKCSAATTLAKAEPFSHILEETNNVNTEVNAAFTATPGSSYHLFFHTYAQDLKERIRENPESVPEALKCSVCDATYTTKSGLVSHLRSHEAIKKSPCASTFSVGYSWSEEFLCDICGRYIQNRCSNLHMQKHFGFSCDLCKESFSCSQRLKDHLRIHMRAMHFMCNICKKFFKVKSKLANHLTLDHNIPLADIDYSKHTYTVPSDPRYKCNDCGLDYSEKGSLISHKRTHHSNVPIIKCDVCNRTFARQSNLVAHMTFHSSKRGDLECDFCKIRFLNRYQIEAHMKRHTNEKRFKCDQCSAVFTETGRLKNHMHTHSCARDFVCDLCGRKYKRKCALSFHMKSHMEKGV